MNRFILFLAAGLLLVVAGCGGSGESEASEGTKGDNVITVGAVPDGFPTSFKEDDELKGFSVDIIKAIVEEAGYEIEFVMTDWNGVLANLQSGKIDTASNFAATEERGQDYNFTAPYYSSKAAIATAEDDDTLKEIEDLTGKQIGNIMGTNFENVLKEQYPDLDYEPVTYESTDVIYTDAGSGKVDGIIHGREHLMAQISKRDLPLRIVGEPFGDQPVALPFKKTEENDAIIADLNKAIEALKEDGKFSEISLEYFDVDLLEDKQ